MMKFTAERDDLMAATFALQHAIDKRVTIPVLSQLRLAATGSEVTLSGTDLDNELSLTVPATVATPGCILVPFDLLRRILEVVSGPVEIARAGDVASVKASGTELTTPALIAADDWPTVAAPKPTHSFSILGQDLRESIQAVRPAICTEETRFYLNGIYLHVLSGALRFVATDGHRLHVRQIPAPEGAEKMPGVIVPRRTIELLMETVRDQHLVSVALNDAKVVFSWPNGRLVAKLIDGHYPDYTRVVPTQFNSTATIDAAAAHVSATRLMVASGEQRSITLDIKSGSIDLRAKGDSMQSATNSLPAELTGPPLEISFQAKYLRSALDGIDGPVCISMSNSADPTVFQPTASPDQFRVLMPSRA